MIKRLREYTDVELLAELVRRNGRNDGPRRVSYSEQWWETLVAIGRDETAFIRYHGDALPLLESETKES